MINILFCIISFSCVDSLTKFLSMYILDIYLNRIQTYHCQLNSRVSSRTCGKVHSAPVFAFVLILYVVNVQSCWFRCCPEERPIVKIFFILPMRCFVRVFAAYIVTETNIFILHLLFVVDARIFDWS